MTRISEIGHVVLKDVREARRQLLLYVAVVVVATLHGIGWGVFSDGRFGTANVIVVLVGGLLVASIVQADSPTASAAFWATHPFRRSSMLGAKSLSALLVILIGVLGQTLAVRSYDLHGSVLVRVVLRPALLYGAILLGVMLLASITRDLRSFLLAAIAIPLGVLVGMSMTNQRISFSHDLTAAVQLLGLLTALGLLSWFYLTRDTRWRTRALTCGVTALSLMSVCSNTYTPEPAGAIVTSLPLAISVERVPQSGHMSWPPNQLPFWIKVAELKDAVSGELEVLSVDIRLQNGSLLHAAGNQGAMDFDHASSFARPSSAGIRWIGEPRRSGGSTQIQARLTSAQRRALAIGVASVSVDARVRLWESGVLYTVPHTVGSGATKGGYRTRVLEWTPQGDESTLAVLESYIDTVGAPSWTMSGFRIPHFALTNDSRREAAPLVRRQGSGGRDGLVLPGVQLVSQRVHLVLREDPFSSVAPPDPDWFQDARLTVITNRYLGTYDIKLQSTTHDVP